MQKSNHPCDVELCTPSCEGDRWFFWIVHHMITYYSFTPWRGYEPSRLINEIKTTAPEQTRASSHAADRRQRSPFFRSFSQRSDSPIISMNTSGMVLGRAKWGCHTPSRTCSADCSAITNTASLGRRGVGWSQGLGRPFGYIAI